MPDLTQLALYFAAALLLAVTPGPGMLMEALNPKTAAFFLAFIPQFVAPAEGYVALQFMVLGFVSVALNTLADIVVAFAAGGIRESAAARPAMIGGLREASGAAMIALGLGLALAKRPASRLLGVLLARPAKGSLRVVNGPFVASNGTEGSLTPTR